LGWRGTNSSFFPFSLSYGVCCFWGLALNIPDKDQWSVSFPFSSVLVWISRGRLSRLPFPPPVAGCAGARVSDVAYKGTASLSPYGGADKMLSFPLLGRRAAFLLVFLPPSCRGPKHRGGSTCPEVVMSSSGDFSLFPRSARLQSRFENPLVPSFFSFFFPPIPSAANCAHPPSLR